MNLTQRLALGVVVLGSALVAAHAALSDRGAALPPIRGELASVRAGRPEIVGSIGAGKLSAGQVVAIADDGRNVFLLQNHTWSRVGTDGAAGPFGSPTRGSPGSIASAADIVVRDSLVIVLDRAARSIATFSRNGRWLGNTRLLPLSNALSFTPEHAAVLADGQLIVTGFRRLGGPRPERIVLRQRSNVTAFDSIAAVPADLFEIMLPVAGASAIRLLASHTYEVLNIDVRGSVTRILRRRNPPRVPLPDSVRRSLARYIEMMPDDGKHRIALPDYFPMVVNSAELANGSIAAAVIVSADSVLIEQVGPDGVPIRTLTPKPIPLPVGVTAHGLIQLREDVNATVVTRVRF